MTRKDPRLCHVADCEVARLIGHGRYYCTDHECSYDSCQRVVNADGRCRLHAYCAVADCWKTRRPVQRAKYCDEHKTSDNYVPTKLVPTPVSGPCVVCGSPVTQRQNIGAGAALLICDRHRDLRPKLKTWRSKYGLTDEQIYDLAHDPKCYVCSQSLAWRLQHWGNPGRVDQIVVDHDHHCVNGCGPDRSCGSCVHGLTDGECNLLLGHLHKLIRKVGPARAHELVDDFDDDAPVPPSVMQKNA